MTKKLMLTVAVALMALPAVAQAQVSGGSLTATATVVNFAEVTGAGDLAFGNLSRSADNVIDAAGGANFAQRTVNYNFNMKVSFEPPTSLMFGSVALPLCTAW